MVHNGINVLFVTISFVLIVACNTEMISESGVNSGSRIAFHSERLGNLDIYTINIDGTDLRQLTDNPTEDSYPSYSPDGTRLVFESDRDGDFEIYLMNIDGTSIVQMTNNDDGDFSATWSPDGSKIAFISFRDGESGEIYEMNGDGSNQTRLTFNDYADEAPHYSPDGIMIVSESGFDTPTARNRQIWTMGADGSNLVQLTDNAGYNGYPVFSSDGNFITFDSNFEGESKVYIMGKDGSNLRALRPGISGPWSPDGSKIAYNGRSGDGQRGIFMMNPDGTDPQWLPNTDAGDGAPSWSPF